MGMTVAIRDTTAQSGHQFHATEVGKLPSDWAATPIDELAIKVGSGITPRGGSKVYQAAGRPFVRSQNIGWGSLLLSDLAYISEDTHRTFNATEIQTDDLLLNITGASIGRCAVANEQLGGGNVNQHVCIIRADQKKACAKFIGYVLLSDIGQRQIDSFQAGGNRQGLNFKQVRSIRVPYPPDLKEQEAIAEALSDADALIESLESLIAKKRAIKQGAMQDLLSGRKRLPGFSGEWREHSFGELFDFLPTATNSRADLTADGDSYYIHYGDIHTRFHSHLDFERLSVPKIAKARCPNAAPVRNGDWIMADASEDFDGVGKSIEVSGLKNETLAVSGLHTFLLREKIKTFAPGFKGHLGNSHELRRQYLRVMTGMKVYGVSKTALKELSLPVPEWTEQAAITEILDDLDEELQGLEAKLSKARQIKQGMMQELLTGRVRLV